MNKKVIEYINRKLHSEDHGGKILKFFQDKVGIGFNVDKEGNIELLEVSLLNNKSDKINERKKKN